MEYAVRSSPIQLTADGKVFLSGCLACSIRNVGGAPVTMTINGGNPILINVNQPLSILPEAFTFPAVEGLRYIDELEFTFGAGENNLHINRQFKVPLLPEVEKTLYNAPK